MIVTAGSTNVTVDVYFVDDDGGTAPGEPTTGLLFSDIETGGSASYHRQGAARVDFTLVTQTVAGAHTDGGFIQIDATNMPGLYRLDVPDAAFTTGVNYVVIHLVAAVANNTVMRPLLIDLTDFDLRDATPAVNVTEIVGGTVPTPAVTGVPDVNVTHFVDGAAPAPATAGVPDVNTVEILDTAVSLTGGDLDVNVAQVSGDAAAADNIELDYDGTGYAKANSTIGTCTTNTDMRGTDNAALASVLGALTDAAAAGDPTATDTIMQYMKQLVNVLVGTTGITTFPAEAAPANNVSLAEVIRAIHVDVTGLNGDAMRGTDNAALASVATEARLAELDAANMPSDLDAVLGDTNELQTDWADGGRLDAILDARASQATADAIETDTQDIQSRLPAALVSGRMAANAEAINDDALAAVRLALSTRRIVIGAAATGTLSITQMTTNLTEASTDHYVGRIIIWTSGNLVDQATDITAYTGAGGLLTFTAVTEAPADTDAFVIL